jgi:Na+-translocating ferredoxin:NAD+ oxidoreductase RnfD subunit
MITKDLRLAALRRFAIAITVLNIAGHAFLGFEQSLAQVLASLATAYALEVLLEVIDARANRRNPRFRGGPRVFIDFLLPSHITGLAVAMLLYSNDRIFPIIFATTVAVGSKAIFQARVGSGKRHFFNPSNVGIATTLLVFPWVGIAPPYQFTENLGGIAHWILPCIFILTGTFLNARFTRRIPLIIAWGSGFALQALIRNVLFGTPWAGGLVPMTGVAFLLFTFYMITDPGTTPTKSLNQVVFGAGVALAYSVLMTFHVAFGLFFALVIVCALRGLGLYLLAARRAQRLAELPASEPVSVVLREAEL